MRYVAPGKMIAGTMRILHIVHQYPPEFIGGTELYTLYLARRQAEAGHRVAVFAPTFAAESSPEAAVEQSVRVYRRPVGSAGRTAVFLRTFRGPAALSQLEQVLDQERPELVHIQHLMGLPAGVGRLLDQRRTPYLVTLHDYYAICANAQLLTNYDQTICAGPDHFLNCARCVQARAGLRPLVAAERALAPLLRRRALALAQVLQGAQAIIAPSDFVRDEYERLGVSPGRITVVRHGIDVPDPLPARRESADGRLRVIYLGGIAWQKGPHVLVEAANGCPPGIEVTIYGDATGQAEYLAGLRRQAHSAAITFAGRLEREQVWPVLAAADVVVVPSLWYETSSLIAAEAQAAGAVVLASNLGALPERVADGRDGLLFPPGDATALRQLLQTLLDQPERLRQLREGIRPVRRVEEHVLEIQELYRSIIS
jgi:glycosyltransferase involved in cell wall biosynthesis